MFSNCRRPSYLRARDRRKDIVPSEKASLMSCKKKVSIAAGNNAIPGTSSTGTFREPAIYLEQEGKKHSPVTARPPPLIPLISVPDFKSEEDTGGNADTSGDAVIELRDLDLVSYDAQSASSCDSDTVIEVETVRAATAVTTTTASSSKLVRTREPVRFTAPPNTETSLSVLSERSDDEECPDDKRDKRKGCVSPATTTTVVTVEPDGASGKRRSNEIVLSPLQLRQN